MQSCIALDGAPITALTDPPPAYNVIFTDRVSLCDAEGFEVANVSIFGNNAVDWPETKRRVSELAAAPVMHSALVHALGALLEKAPEEKEVIARTFRAIAAAEGWA